MYAVRRSGPPKQTFGRQVEPAARRIPHRDLPGARRRDHERVRARADDPEVPGVVEGDAVGGELHAEVRAVLLARAERAVGTDREARDARLHGLGNVDVTPSHPWRSRPMRLIAASSMRITTGAAAPAPSPGPPRAVPCARGSPRVCRRASSPARDPAPPSLCPSTSRGGAGPASGRAPAPRRAGGRAPCGG